jgi:nicotinamidase-related amidase
MEEQLMATALLLIDIQKGMWMEAAKPYKGEAMLKNAADLLARARSAGIPIIHIQHDGGSGDTLCKGTEGFDIHPAVSPQAGETRIVKSHCSSFRDTGLDAALKRLGVDKVVIAGMQTDFCVDTACRIAHGLGYEVILAEDAHSTMDNSVMTAEQLIAYHGGLLKDRFAKFQPAAAIAF